jgi:hypothetical protein
LYEVVMVMGVGVDVGAGASAGNGGGMVFTIMGLACVVGHISPVAP